MTVFFDNTFSFRIVECLKALGAEALHLRDEFSPDTKDPIWLEDVDRKGYVVITADARIRRDPAVRAVFHGTSLTVLFVWNGFIQTRFWDQAAWMVKNWPAIEAVLSRAKSSTSYEINTRGKIEECSRR